MSGTIVPPHGDDNAVRAGSDAAPSSAAALEESTEATAKPSVSVGQQLRAARQAKNLAVDEVAKALKLSAAQADKIDAIATKARKDEIKLRAEVELAQADLDDAMDHDPLDQKQAAALVDTFVQLHADLEKQRMLMLLEIRGVLTKEQHLKLQQLLMGRMRVSSGMAGGK